MTNIVLNSRKMIESYLSGEIGFEFLSKKHSAPYTSLRNWVHGYEKNNHTLSIPKNMVIFIVPYIFNTNEIIKLISSLCFSLIIS